MTTIFTQNDNFVHPGQFWALLFEFVHLYITVILFSAWDKSHDPWANWSKTRTHVDHLERVMTTKRDRKKRVFRSTMHSVIFLRCVLTIFRLLAKVGSLIFLLSSSCCLAFIKAWWGRCQTQKICKIYLLLRSLYDWKTFQSCFFLIFAF